jgi:hypothetical protein
MKSCDGVHFVVDPVTFCHYYQNVSNEKRSENIMTSIDLPEELKIWNAMHPMQRLDVMQKTPYVKSINKRFKMCLAYIKANVEQYR